MSLLASILLAGATLSAPDYLARLAVIEGFLSTGDLEQVKALAHDLEGSSCDVGGNIVAVDAALLDALKNVKEGESVAPYRTRVLATLRSLEAQVPASPRPPDPELAARIRAGWDTSMAAGGTAVPSLNLPLPDTLVPEWVYDLWLRFVKWIDSLFGTKTDPNKPTLGASGVATMIAVLAVLLIVSAAFWAFRRRGTVLEAAQEEAPALDEDEDPTARASEEWIAHAQSLEKQGRFREALRAWYHAVLSAMISRGLVPYGKEKTNWEYVRAVSPGAAFRPGLTNATVRFERFWYGGGSTTAEVVAEQRLEAQKCITQMGARRTT